MVVAEPAPVMVIGAVMDRRFEMLRTYVPAGRVMVLASETSALAASIASRSEQSPVWQAPRSLSLVRVTAKLAARTSLTWRQPSARLPASAAKCRRRDLVVFVFGADIRVPLRRVALAGARDLRGLVRRPSRGK